MLLEIPQSEKILTGIEYKLIILNDADLTTIKQVNH